MWEPLTEQTRRSVLIAQEEATILGDSYIGSEHLLLGMIIGNEPIAEVLKKFGVEPPNIREEIEKSFRRDKEEEKEKEIVFTPRSKRIIELAFESAQETYNNYILPEHILLAIIKDGESVAARVLHNLKVDFKELKAEVEKIVGRDKEGLKPIIIPKGKKIDIFGEPDEIPKDKGVIFNIFDARIKEIVEASIGEAEDMNHNYLTPEHLLLGILNEAEELTTKALSNLGITPSMIRDQLIKLMKEDEEP